MNFRESVRVAAIYRAMGFNPIPSCPKLGFPPWPYTDARDRGLSARSFERMARDYGWTNIQIATGRRWGLVALDVDGPIASNILAGWCLWNPLPPTWTVDTPNGGRHHWFRVPASSDPIPTRKLWESGQDDHDALEILGDRALVKAPPSVRVIGGTWVEYRWSPGLAPPDLPLAPFPDWLRLMPSAAGKIAEISKPPLAGAYTPGVVKRWTPGGKLPDWRDVLASIPDKTEIARAWGVQLHSAHVNASGWIRAYSAFRKDRNPSAMFSANTGRYWEPEMGRNPITLFDLGIRLGFYPDFATALMSIAYENGWRP